MNNDILCLAISRGVAEIVLNRPAQLNAINCALAERLLEALIAIDRDSSVRVCLLRGAGRAFMAGGDLKDFHEAGERAPEAVGRLIEPFHQIVRRIREFRVPVIAAVHGAVAGGGLALALACDLIVASTDAVFTPAYLAIGATPDGGTTWSVSRLIGERRALEWLMLGHAMSAEQAQTLGLINRVFARDALEREAASLADRIAAGPAKAQSSLKRLIWRARNGSIDDQMEAEAASFMSLAATADFREGVAAFFERRRPRFG